MEHWFVEHNRRDLNWLKSVHVRQPDGEVREYKLPFPCDKCDANAMYAREGNSLCPEHFHDHQIRID